eukprot:TRINITY_DN2106_c0_g1_i1.p1 TRINITY_DN2106_c0_g1~~TRINITY_DN2106_c0_g1_i1.p1  ORF type:complete len:359 (-),score=55.98 TRINITY_DN2106_c0_g1_i1:91-1167(-)
MQDPLDLENWYPFLSSHTFPTQFVDLSSEEAQCIIDLYDDIKFKGEKTKNETTQAVLKGLETRIDVCIERFGAKDRGVFIKLSTRSPKDTPLKYPERTIEQIKNELAQLGVPISELNPYKHPSPYIIPEIISIIRTMSRSMRVFNGKEAIELLAPSERVYQDLFGRLLRNENNDFQMKIVLREWVDILPELEFRGFVHKGRFNALTQYYKACYVPQIARDKNLIQDAVVDLFLKIQPILSSLNPPIDNYVADFSLCEYSNEGKVGYRCLLIELNHWGSTASSSLFDWNADSKVLHEGPFEFRVVEKEVENVQQTIARPLRFMMNTIFPGWDSLPEQPKETEKSSEKGEEKESSKCIVS